ncbi:MAG TPA: TOBE domain-containing protein, partial [Pusillimonas sp.]
PTAQVFQQPKSLRVARAFSDPPMNFFKAFRVPGGVQLPRSVLLPLALSDAAAGSEQDLTVGLRASSLRLQERDGDLSLHGKVLLAEISGSDTYVHLSSDIGDLVAQVAGVHHFTLGAAQTLYFAPSAVFVFDAAGDLLLAPLSARSF